MKYTYIETEIVPPYSEKAKEICLKYKLMQTLKKTKKITLMTDIKDGHKGIY